jgi:hypothetical protein
MDAAMTSLKAGSCLNAMIRRAAAYAKHAADVRRAIKLWREHKSPEAHRQYHAEWRTKKWKKKRSAPVDALFLRYC